MFLTLLFVYNVAVSPSYIHLNQINVPLYYLGVFLAGLVSFRSNHDATQNSDLTSFRWVHAVRLTNYQTVVLALVLFAIVFSTKDKAISRLFIGSFLVVFWLSVIPLNRYVPEWIAQLAFRGGEFNVHSLFGQ